MAPHHPTPQEQITEQDTTRTMLASFLLTSPERIFSAAASVPSPQVDLLAKQLYTGVLAMAVALSPGKLLIVPWEKGTLHAV